MLEQIRKAGWLVAEAGLLIVILCVLIDIILGTESAGTFVASVAANANAFLRALPAGTMVGLALIALVYWFVKSER
jgi:hypothetical protein